MRVWLSVLAFATVLFAPAALADPLRPVIAVLGEEGDLDLDIEPITKAFMHYPDFERPTVLWAPTEAQLLNLPTDTPVVILAHTTPDNETVTPSPTRNPQDMYPYEVMPPFADPFYHSGIGEPFFWGWPEPFPWLNSTAVQPARSALSALAPFVRFDTVILASCSSIQLELVLPSPLFDHFIGLSSEDILIEPNADGTLPAYDRLSVVLGLYSSYILDDLSTHAAAPGLAPGVQQDLDASGAVRARRTGARFADEVRSVRGTTGADLSAFWLEVLAMGGPAALNGGGAAAAAGAGAVAGAGAGAGAAAADDDDDYNTAALMAALNDYASVAVDHSRGGGAPAGTGDGSGVDDDVDWAQLLVDTDGDGDADADADTDSALEAALLAGALGGEPE